MFGFEPSHDIKCVSFWRGAIFLHTFGGASDLMPSFQTTQHMSYGFKASSSERLGGCIRLVIGVTVDVNIAIWLECGLHFCQLIHRHLHCPSDLSAIEGFTFVNIDNCESGFALL
jgi:hypothetical protein